MQSSALSRYFRIVWVLTSASFTPSSAFGTPNRYKFPYRSKFPDRNNSSDRYNFSKQGRSRVYAFAVGPTKRSRTCETPVVPVLSGL